MSYEKYIKKGGKVFGPYIYESQRVGNKVITKYIGSKQPDLNNPKKILGNYRKNIYLTLFSLLFLVSIFSLIFFFPSSPTGRVVLQISPKYISNDSIGGSASINLKNGEFIPAEAIVKVELNGIERKMPLNQLISETPSQGNFYLENFDISGQGGGYGFLGEKKSYPDVSFKLLIYKSVDEQETSSKNQSETSNEAPSGTSAESPIETPSEVPSENPTGTQAETPTETQTSGEVASETSSASGITSAGVSDNPESDSGLTESIVSGESSSSPETSSSSELGSGSSESSPITGNVIGDSKEIDVTINALKNFTTDLASDEGAEVVSDSVQSEGQSLSSDVIKLEIADGKVEASTDYSTAEQGYGKDYLTDKVKTFNIDLKKLGLTATSGIMDISIIYNNETIAEAQTQITASGVQENETTMNETAIENETINNVSTKLLKNIPDIIIKENGNYSLNLDNYFFNATNYSFSIPDNISIIVDGNIATIIPGNNFTGTKISKVTASNDGDRVESNEFNIIVSEENVSISTLQGRIRLGKPVKWSKIVTKNADEQVKVSIPEVAENISIIRIGGEAVNDENSNSRAGGITGNVALEISQGKGTLFDKLKSVFGQAKNRITGNAVSDDTGLNDTAQVTENGNTKEVTISDNSTQYEVSYETPAPTAVEDRTGKGEKQITIESQIPYEDVVAYTFVEESSADKVSVEGAKTSELVDNNKDGLVDEVLWVADTGDNVTIKIKSSEDDDIHSRGANANIYKNNDSTFTAYVYGDNVNVEENGSYVPITQALDMYSDYQSNVYINFNDTQLILKPYYYIHDKKYYLESLASETTLAYTHIYDNKRAYKYALGIFNFSEFNANKVGFDISSSSEVNVNENKLISGGIDIDFSDIAESYSLDMNKDRIEVSGDFSSGDLWLDPTITVLGNPTLSEGGVYSIGCDGAGLTAISSINYGLKTSNSYCYVGYMKFNTTLIPKSAKVNFIQLNYSVGKVSVDTNQKICGLTSVATNAIIWQNSTSCSGMNSTFFSSAGWHNATLTNLTTLFNAYLSKEWFAVGISTANDGASGGPGNINESTTNAPPTLIVNFNYTFDTTHIFISSPANNTQMNVTSVPINISILNQDNFTTRVQVYANDTTNRSSYFLLNDFNISESQMPSYNFTYTLSVIPPRTNDPNVVQYYPYDADRYSVVSNLYYSSRSALCVGLPVLSPSGKFAGDVLANTSQCGMEISSVSSDITNMLTHQNFSIEFWMNTSSASGVQEIIVLGQAGAGQNYTFRITKANTNSNDLFFITYNSSQSSDTLNSTSGGGITLGIWHHIVVTYNGGSKKLYIDGILNRSGTVTTPLATLPTGNLTFGATANIDSDASGGGVNPYYGEIDNIIIYNKSLTATEVSNHYLLVNDTYNIRVKASNPYNSSQIDYNYLVGSSGGSSDTTAPYFTLIPDGQQITYNTAFSVRFNATDETAFGYWAVNNSLFSINTTGGLINATMLAVNSYYVNVSINDTTGNSNSTIYNLNVTRASSTIGLTATTPINYGTSTNFAGSGCPDASCSLNITNTIYGVGVINANYSFAGNQNYSASSAVFTVTINKASQTATLTFNETSLINYGKSLNTTCNGELWRNDTNVTASEQSQSVLYGSMNHAFSCKLYANQNYSYDDDNSTFTINKASQSISPLLNGNNANLIVSYPQQVNASYSGASIGAIVISINNTAITRDINYTFASGNYWFNYSAAGNQNYSVNESYLNLTINQVSTSILAYINNTEGNYTADNSSASILVNGTLSIVGNIDLYLNGTIINSGASPLFNFTNFTTGFYNFSAVFAGNQNYSSSLETFWVNVSAVTTPPLDLSLCGSTLAANTAYVLNQSLNSSGTCLTVTANNITIDGNGYNITYGTSSTSNTYGVYSYGNGTIINNLTIRPGNAVGSGKHDIYLYKSSNSKIYENNLTTSGTSGYAVYVNSVADNNLIMNNTIQTIGGTAYGIDIDGNSNYSIVDNNTISTSGSSAAGITVRTGSSYNNLTRNNIYILQTAIGYGIYLFSTLNNNLIDSNVINATSSSGVGIYLQTNANSSTIRNNNIVTSGTAGHGIYLTGTSNSNSIGDNTIKARSTGYGIYLGTSHGNTIYNNSVISLGTNALYMVSAGLDTSRNYIYNNIFNGTTAGTPYYVSAGYSLLNTTKAAATNILGGINLGGNFWVRVGTIYPIGCSDNNADGICDQILNISSNNVDYLPLAINDTTPPTVDLYSPLNNSFINGVVAISATASDDRKVDNVTFYYRNSTTPAPGWAGWTYLGVDSTGPYAYSWNTALFGNNTDGYDIRAVAIDPSGNTAEVVKHYVIDRTRPYMKDITVAYPGSQSSIRNGQNVTLKVNVSDAPIAGAGINFTASNISSFNQTMGNSTMAFELGSTHSDSWSVWNLSVTINGVTGSRYAPIYVYDNATPTNNVQNGQVFYVEVDNLAPNYTGFSGPSDSYAGLDEAFSVIAYDNWTLSGYKFASNFSGKWSNDSAVAISGKSAAISVTKKMLLAGGWAYRFYIYDDAGNINDTGERTINVTSPPDFSIDRKNPGLSIIQNSASVPFNFSYSSGTALNCSLYIDDVISQSWGSPAANTDLTTSKTLAEGSHTWYVECYDDAETQYITDDRNILIDLTAPTVSILYPTNGNTYTTQVLSLNYTASDSYLDKCWYSLGGSNISINCNENISSASPEGGNTWIVYANDTAGNVGSATTAFTFTAPDVTPPYFTLIPNGVNINLTNGDRLDVTFNATDNIVFNSYAVNLSILTFNTTGGLKNNSALSIGTYYVNVTINDTSNNANSTIYNFNVSQYPPDVTPPYFTLIPGNQIINWSNNFQVSFNATDAVAFNSYAVNDTSNFAMNTTGGLYNVTSLQVGNYYVNVTINDTANNANSTIYNLNVSQLSQIASLGFNETSPITYGKSLNVTCNGELWRNDTNVTATEQSQSTLLGAMDYAYSCKLYSSQNYSYSESNSTFSVNKLATIITTYINNTSGNFGADNRSVNIWLNGSLSVAGNIELYLNGTIINSGVSPLSNLTNLSLGAYNFSAVYSGNQNYTASSYTLNVTIILYDKTPPDIENVSSSASSSSATLTWDTNELANSSVYYGTTTAVTSRENSASLIYSHSITLSGLSSSTFYDYNVSSCDNSGNCNTSVQYNFTTSSGGGGSCFPAGTKILMAGGKENNIENVKVGDEILSYDTNKMALEESKVLEIESPIREHLCELILNDKTSLNLTNEHPVYTETGWKSINPEETARENSKIGVNRLEVGDNVFTLVGYKIVAQIECWNETVQTYNLKSVSNYNNYFAEGVLVHNKGGGGGGGGGGTCTPNWQCSDWSDCLSGHQTRTCTDTKGCETRPSVEMRECVNSSCTENWNCSEWSPCESKESTSTRTCTDLNNCGTELSKPEITSDCGKCNPDLECGDWSGCQVRYGINDLAQTETNISGTMFRQCTDSNNCTGADLIVDNSSCDLRVPLRTEETEWCNQTYLELYNSNTNTLVSRVKATEVRNVTRLDIGLIVSEFKGYCDYCYDRIKNYDETGVDCGGSCPACIGYSTGVNWFKAFLIFLWILTMVSCALYIYTSVRGRKNENKYTRKEKKRIKGIDKIKNSKK